MSSQRYQRVNAHDEDEENESFPGLHSADTRPSSPPPSFHSRSSSPSSRRLLHDADQTLADTFGEGDSDADDEPDDRQRLMRGNPEPQTQQNTSGGSSSSSAGAGAGSSGSAENGQDGERGPSIQRRVTMLPSFTTPTPAPTSGRVVRSANDGVFANLAAKPERGEKNEDLPPSYEQAAADATPPYWETTIVAPGMSSDEVYVDGLPVGSVFSFVWNGMISMSFQLVGFLLTYLLHTTHAAKNGSRAGLGLTLVQYGFYMKGSSESRGPDPSTDQYIPPPDPNSHDFNPNSVGDNAAAAVGAESQGGSDAISAITTSEWIAYILMIIGWFILIRAVSDFLRARRHEQLVLQSPDRGLSVPVIAEGERAETVV
ncbi:hypothetical protein VTN00DRAFT_5656 [Thermoascus crustaceus]|uniref:uncharacterized protein n=1 Tax=Thermoascus crustaceus TaxID=5088 RepID=UPI00374483D4